MDIVRFVPSIFLVDEINKIQMSTVTNLRIKRVQLLMELFDLDKELAELDRELEQVVVANNLRNVSDAARRFRRSGRYREGCPVVDLTEEFDNV